jgi:hypothetical protein
VSQVPEQRSSAMCGCKKFAVSAGSRNSVIRRKAAATRCLGKVVRAFSFLDGEVEVARILASLPVVQ